MKILLKMNEYLKLIAVISLVCLCNSYAKAQGDKTDPYPDYLEEIFMDMDFNQNLTTPEVPKNLKKKVAQYVKKAAEEFQSQLPPQIAGSVKVELTRNGEVLLVTFPSEELFNPNDTLLSKYADRSLQTLVPLMKDPYLYKVVYAVSSDDTGTETYRNELTDARMNSLYDWLLDRIDDGSVPEEIIIIPETWGSSRPIPGTEQPSRDNRRKNRRVEFYFIPGPRLIELVGKS